MSNPTVSFRISDYHLARGLKAIRTIEPAWQLTTPSNLIRTIFNDYIAKSEQRNNTSLDVTPELLHEIVLSRAGVISAKQLDILPQITKPRQKSEDQIRREIEEEKIFNKIKNEAKQEPEPKPETETDEQLDEQIKLASQTARKLNSKPSEYNDPNLSDSEITSVTDFSPPTDWKE